MPLFILFVGILLFIVGINNKIPEFVGLLKEDFRPSNDNVPGFHVWIIAIVATGFLGYVNKLKPLSNIFLVLIIVVLILSNGGFAEKFTKALEG